MASVPMRTGLLSVSAIQVGPVLIVTPASNTRAAQTKAPVIVHGSAIARLI